MQLRAWSAAAGLILGLVGLGAAYFFDTEIVDPQSKVAEIRQRIYEQTDLAAGGWRLIEAYPRSTQELLAIYKANTGGVFCGGTAYTLQQAYSDAGYEAWILYYGFQLPLLTHSTTLVRVGDTIYLQDAYLNFDYPVPFFEVLDQLRAGVVPKPRVSPGDRDVLVLSKKDISRSWAVAPGSPCAELAEGYVCRTPANLTLLLQRYMTTDPIGVATLDRLEELGLPRDVNYLLLLPFAIFDAKFPAKSYMTDPADSPLLQEIARHVRPDAEINLVARTSLIGDRQDR